MTNPCSVAFQVALTPTDFSVAPNFASPAFRLKLSSLRFLCGVPACGSCASAGNSPSRKSERPDSP